MNKRQFEHYIKGGYFQALYDPEDKKSVDKKNKKFIGKKIMCYHPINAFPGMNGTHQGQYRFASKEVSGSINEHDLKELEIDPLNKRTLFPVNLPQFVYRLTYETKNKVMWNFGEEMPLPFHLYRCQSQPDHNNVIFMSRPQADKIEMAVWRGEQKIDKLSWEDIGLEPYPESKVNQIETPVTFENNTDEKADQETEQTNDEREPQVETPTIDPEDYYPPVYPTEEIPVMDENEDDY